MAETFDVIVRGQEEFMAALHKAQRDAYRQAQQGIRTAGQVVLQATRQNAPVGGGRDPHPGKLKSSYRVSVRGLYGRIVSSAPYAGGAEWGRKGKWKGFAKYGAPGRIALKAVEETAGRIAVTITAALKDVIALGGWAR